MVDTTTLENKPGYNISYFLSCDWGTSSFRLNLVDAQKGNILYTISNSFGIKKIYDQWESSKEPMDRIDYYRTFLKQQIEDLKNKCSRSIEQPPVFISGMASSSIGMKELPYVPIPFSINEPNLTVEVFEATKSFPHNIYLISGLQSEADVMRGEETELLGLFTTTGITNGLYLLAGTHSKHVTVLEKIIIDFKTYMTGELFNLLSSKSILSNSLKSSENGDPGPAFKEGVADALNSNLLHQLFSIRATDLIGQSNPVDNYNYLSGLLIGTELKDIQHLQEVPIVLAGNRQLQKYYTTALDLLNINYIIPGLSYQEITSLGQSIIFNHLRTKL